MIDTYLEPWEQFQSRDSLRQCFALAQQLARLNRTLTWAQVLAPLSLAARGDDADAVAGL